MCINFALTFFCLFKLTVCELIITFAFLAGDLSQDQLGLATLPSKQKEFRDKLELTIEYAKALSCKRLVLKGDFECERWNDIYFQWSNQLKGMNYLFFPHPIHG